MKRVVIIGAGGFGREIVSFLKFDKEYKIEGFVDADTSLSGKIIDDILVLGTDQELEKIKKDGVLCAFVAIGNSEIRASVYEKVKSLGFEIINVVHPSSIIASDVSMGNGNIIYPNVTINTGVIIGNSALINSNVSVGHDVKIGNFTNINSGVNIAGRVTIRDLSFLGIGCSVLENIVIGSKVIVGGGALVCKDVADELIVVGVPAKPIRKK